MEVAKRSYTVEGVCEEINPHFFDEFGYGIADDDRTGKVRDWYLGND